MLPMDRETALLDLLGGWLELVEECHELARLPRDAFETEYFADQPVDPATYDAWRQHYDEDYVATVRQLHQDAQDLILADAGDAPDVTPAEFVRDELLPLFRLRGEN